MSVFWAVNETEEKRSKKTILQNLAIGENPSFVHSVRQNSEPKKCIREIV
jgi:hypothetical protein